MFLRIAMYVLGGLIVNRNFAEIHVQKGKPARRAYINALANIRAGPLAISRYRGLPKGHRSLVAACEESHSPYGQRGLESIKSKYENPR